MHNAMSRRLPGMIRRAQSAVKQARQANRLVRNVPKTCHKCQAFYQTTPNTQYCPECGTEFGKRV